MLIMVSGPYSAGTEEGRKENLLALNRAAVAVLRMGHVPVVGVNAALPIADAVETKDHYETIMKISLALAAVCDAVLMTGESPGARREREVFERKGLPIYRDVRDIPAQPSAH